MHAPRFASLSLPLLAVTLFALGACKDPQTPEAEVRELLAEGVKALEEKDIEAAGDLLDDDYKDATGRDRRKVKAIAFFVLRQGPVHLSLSDEQITLAEDGKSAKVTLKVTALQTAGAPTTVGDLLPRGRATEVELSLVRRGDNWRIKAIDGDGMSRGELD